MKTSYNSFLLEKYSNDLLLLLEDHIYSSSSFLMKIKSLKDEPGQVGNIAKSIFRIIDDYAWFDNDKIKQNFFDTTDKDDKVSFLMNNKISDDWDDEEDASYPYTMSGRNEMKIGRIIIYLCKLSGLDVKPQDIEKFVNIYKSKSVSNSIEFRLVSGKDIAKYYKGKNTYDSEGSLGNSCMIDVDKKRFKIYTENKDKVNLLIYINNDGKIMGRSLVWKLDESPCDAKYFMDRVYATRDSDIYKFINYAKENNWMYKKRQGYGNDEAVEFIYKGGFVYGEIKVNLNGDFKKYPFLDTLAFLSKNKKYLSNLPSKKSYWLHDHEYGHRERCYDCDGDLYQEVWFNKKKVLCDECCSGHKNLFDRGIETKVNKRFFDNDEN